MTPEEFAVTTGLTVEEASLILHRLQAASEPADARVTRARSILALAQKKVGVHPVEVEADSLAKAFDPDAEQSTFYHKDGRKDVSVVEKSRFSDPPGWDEFDQSGKDSE